MSTLSIELTNTQKRELSLMAYVHGTSMSALVRGMIAREIDSHVSVLLTGRPKLVLLQGGKGAECEVVKEMARAE